MRLPNDNRMWTDSAARWICMAGCEASANLYLEFVKEFELPSGGDLEMDITAFTQYRVSVNGRVVGRGPAVGYRTRCYFDRYRISSDHLRVGRNVVTVLVYHEGSTSKTVQDFDYGLPGLLCRIRGEKFECVSDSSWRVRRSRVYSGVSQVSRWGGYKELYHGEKEDSWEGSEFDSSLWDCAIVVGEATDGTLAESLVLNRLPALEVTEHAPVRIVQVSANLGQVSLSADAMPQPYEDHPIRFEAGEYGCCPAVTLDFGWLKVGYPEIEMRGAFCIYEVWYGETLDVVRLDVIRNPSSCVWKGFQRRAFRYLQVRIIAMEGPVALHRVRVHNTWYAYDDSGHAECSDVQITRTLDVSKYTVRANTSYHYEDCPWREQALWIFDTRAMSLINYYFFGDADLVAKNLRQLFALQGEDGHVPATGPKQNSICHLDFCLHLVSTVREHYEYSYDAGLLSELREPLQELDRFVQRFSREDGLLCGGFPGRDFAAPFLDWSMEIERSGASVILNALYARYLDDLAMICEVCGEDAGEYVSRAASIRVAAHGLLFDADAGLYRDSLVDGALSEHISMQGNLAALYGGFVPDENVDGLFEKMQDREHYRPPYAPSFYLVVFEALAKYGRYEEILDHIRRYWGGMLARGATTWWETFDPDTPQWVYPHPFLGNVPTYEWDEVPISTCHGWSGIAGYAIPRYLFGVDLFQRPQGRITVRPGLGGRFEKFDYRVPCAGGVLWLEFNRKGGEYDITVKDTPPDTELIIEESVYGQTNDK